MKLSRTPAVVLAVLAAAVTLAACGSSTPSSSSSSGAVGARGAALAGRSKLVACLKQHGVTLPARPQGAGAPGGYGSGGGPPANGAGPLPQTRRRPGGPFGGRFSSNPKLRAAFQACGADFRGRFGGAPRRAAIEQFVTCVNKHGYKLPQPNFSGPGSIFPARIQRNAKFQAASRACQSLLAPRGPAGSQSGSGSGPPPSA
jgi:hypothetical protein